MKKHEIVIGGRYVAKVSGKATTVRVDAIREPDYWTSKARLVYDVTNLTTGRKLTFQSAQRFRRAAVIGDREAVGTRDPVAGCADTGFNNRHED